jgi:hypothetical protein
MFSLLHLFCSVDDFCHAFLPLWREQQLPAQGTECKRRRRASRLSESEIMTIVIAFHASRFRDFKTFYLVQVCQTWRAEFPRAVSYNRFIELIPRTLVPLAAYLRSLCGRCSGISFLDSTALEVCDSHRINRHKVFAGIAQRGKTSTGWFYGFKLHLVVNDCGELLNLRLTPGNVDDRNPVPDLLAGMQGKFFADKGYISQALFDYLFKQDVELITRPRKNMKARLLSLTDAMLLRKRAIIESIIDQLKNISQIEHTRHRACTGFLWNLIAGLIAYCHQPKKPSLNLRNEQTESTALAIA